MCSMKQINTIIGVALIFMISLASCDKRGDETIEHLDQLAETDPQSALTKIRHVDTTNFDRYEQMRLSLIKYKVEDKLLVLPLNA